MGMTITEKIIAAHAGLDEVSPGQLVEVKVDLVLANDITAPLAINSLEEAGVDKVFDSDRIALVPDHFTPNKDIKAAMQALAVRQFAKKHHITWYFEVGEVGIEHALLPERGLVLPGDLVIGADSHTCTYGGIGAFSTGMGSTDIAYAMATGETWLRVPESIKITVSGKKNRWFYGKDLILHLIGRIGTDGATYRTIEFAGDGMMEFTVEERLTICNMGVEAGAKNAIVPPDDITIEWIKERANRKFEIYSSDDDAGYVSEVSINLGDLEPCVAKPYSPANVVPVSEIEKEKIAVDQVFIGSCTNGWFSDLKIAAEVLKGKKVKRGVRVIVIPSTPMIWKKALDEGILSTFIEAGAVIGPPTCGPCLGGHMGILAEGEVAVSTSNRNFVGRMGHPSSKVYLSNPAVAAAAAVTGYIIHPDNVV